VPSKAPEIADVNDLTLGISIACCALPVLSFMEMFCTFEMILPATLTHPWIAAAAPVFATLVRMLEVVFIALVMAALRGLAVLVQELNPKAAGEMNLSRKSTYCQCFLGGLRLLPILYHLFQCTWCEGALDSRRADAARSILICLGSMVCTWTGCRAFPVDAHHYPELKAAAQVDQSQAVKMILKPVLDVVQFCPFCGSGDLELEENGTDSASCPHCSARQVPVNLIVHRDRTAVDVSSAAGKWLDSSASSSAAGKASVQEK